MIVMTGVKGATINWKARIVFLKLYVHQHAWQNEEKDRHRTLATQPFTRRIKFSYLSSPVCTISILPLVAYFKPQLLTSLPTFPRTVLLLNEKTMP